MITRTPLPGHHVDHPYRPSIGLWYRLNHVVSPSISRLGVASSLNWVSRPGKARIPPILGSARQRGGTRQTRSQQPREDSGSARHVSRSARSRSSRGGSRGVAMLSRVRMRCRPISPPRCVWAVGQLLFLGLSELPARLPASFSLDLCAA